MEKRRLEEIISSLEGQISGLEEENESLRNKVKKLEPANSKLTEENKRLKVYEDSAKRGYDRHVLNAEYSTCPICHESVHFENMDEEGNICNNCHRIYSMMAKNKLEQQSKVKRFLSKLFL